MMEHGLRRGAMVMSLMALSAVSCRPEARPASDQSADSAARVDQTAKAQSAAGHYSIQDFGRLRWLEGSWRGQLPDGGHFYERYRFLDDSTIAMSGFADSTFTRATDSASITMRGGTVTDEGVSARWVATRLDSSVVDFASVQGPSNSFSWARESPDRWTATLHSGDRERPPTVYRMERVRR